MLRLGRNAHVPPPPIIPISGLRELIRKNPAGKAITYKEDTSTSQKRIAIHGATAGGAARAEWNAYSTSIQTHFVTDIPFVSKVAGAANKVPFIARGVLIEPVGHLAHAGDTRDVPTRTLSALAYVALAVDAADAVTGMNRLSILYSNYYDTNELLTIFGIDVLVDSEIDLAAFVHEDAANALIFVDATNQDDLLPRFQETEALARDWIDNGNVPARVAPALINANPLGAPVPPAAGFNRPRADLVDLVRQEDGHVTTAQLFHLLMSQSTTSQGKSDSEDQKRLTTHLVRFMDQDFVSAIGGDQLNPKNILFSANNQLKERIVIFFSHTFVTITSAQIKNIFLLHLKEFFQSSAAVEVFVKCLNPFSAKAFNDYFTLLIDVLSLFMSRDFVALLQGINDDLNRFLNRQQNARSFELEIMQYFLNEIEVRLCLPKVFPTTLSLLESKTIHNAIGVPLEVPPLSFTNGSQLHNILLAHVQRLDRDRVGNTISKLEARLSAQTVSDRPQAGTNNSRRPHDNHQTGYGQRYPFPSSNDRGRGAHTGGRNARDRSRDDNRDIRPMSLDDICLSMMVGRQCTFTNCRRLHVPVPPNLQHLVQQYIRAHPPRAALPPPPPPHDNRALQRYVPAEHRAPPPRGRG